MAGKQNPWATSLKPKNEDLESFLLTYEEAARLLRVCKRTVERLVADGALPVIRVGRSPRIPRAALMQWIERATMPVTAKSKEDGHGQLSL